MGVSLKTFLGKNSCLTRKNPIGGVQLAQMFIIITNNTLWINYQDTDIQKTLEAPNSPWCVEFLYPLAPILSPRTTSPPSLDLNATDGLQ